MVDEKDAPDVIDLENTVIEVIQKNQSNQLKMIENLQTNLMRLAEGKELEMLVLVDVGGMDDASSD